MARRRQDLKECENVELIGDVLSHLIEADSHEADVRTTQLIGRLLRTHSIHRFTAMNAADQIYRSTTPRREVLSLESVL